MIRMFFKNRGSIQHQKKNFFGAGFTLVEMLIYMAVLVLVSTIVVATFISLKNVFERNRVERELADAAVSILERIARETHNAVSVDTVGSTLNTSPGVLSLARGATTTAFSVSGDDVVVVQNGVSLGPLDPAHVSVRALTFWHYTNATSSAVRVALTLSATSSVASTTKTFYTTAVLRGSYE